MNIFVRNMVIGACLLLAPLSVRAADSELAEQKKQEFIAELDENIGKTDEAIKILRNQIEETREAPYIPDLYFRLAELYVEKSRYQFYKRREISAGQTIKINEAGDVVESKERALEIYQGILKDYPRYRDNDKIHFFMAHEYRELGRTDDMLRQYRTILSDYKESSYRGEAYLLLGDYYFDRRELRESKDNYRRVIDLPETKATNLARYKLAWVYINEDDNRNALQLFEDIAKSSLAAAAKAQANKADGKKEEEAPGINIVREGLIDSVLCYTEVRKPEDALNFYRNLADSEITYMKVVSRLANRYYIRNQLKDAAVIYREILKINPNIVDSKEQVARLFEYTRKANDITEAQEDIEILVRQMSRYLHSYRVDEKDRLEAYNNFERSARDVATKLHVEARQTKKLALFHKSTKAYKQYLSLFGDSKFAAEIQKNYAEALYAAGDFVKAGKEYEKVVAAIPADSKDDKQRMEILNSTIYAYFEALKNPDNLTRLESIEARRGFIAAGKQYVASFPQAKETPNLMFSIGRSYYDLAEYEDAIKTFAEFIDKYPEHPKVSEAGHLALDAYHFKKDFEGLAKFGKSLMAKSSIKDAKFKAEVADIVQQSEFKSIESAVDRAPRQRGASSAQGYIDFAKQYKQSELGEKALYNAFVTAKKESNANLMQRSGEELITQFPKSNYLKDVIPTLGNIALETGDFEQAANNFEIYSEKFSLDQQSGNLLYNAATIRRLLSDYDRAVGSFLKVLKDGKRADLNEVRWQLALTYEDAGEWNNVALVLQDLIARGRNSVDANFKLGQAYMETNRATQGFQQFRQAIALYPRIQPASRRQEEIDAAAGARFMLMRSSYNNYVSMAVRPGLPEEKVVQDKSKSIGQLEQEAAEIAKYGSSTWTIASVYLVSQAYRHLADFLTKTSIPAGLNAAQKQQYTTLLNQQSSQLRNQAKQTCNAAVQKAHASDIFNDYVKSCIQGEEVPKTYPAGRTNAAFSSSAVQEREQYRQALLRNPRDVASLTGFAKLHLDVGNYHEARLLLMRAVELGSQDWQTYNGLGVVLWHLAKHQEAYFQFRKALNLAKQGGGAQAALNLAALYREYGNNNKAQALLKQVGGRLSKADVQRGDLLPGARELFK